MKILSVPAKSPEKWKLNFSRSALFQIKTRVYIKYFEISFRRLQQRPKYRSECIRIVLWLHIS